MGVIIKKTTKLDQQLALMAIDLIVKNELEVTESKEKSVKIRIADSEELIEIPLQAFIFLSSILDNMAKGKSLALLPTDTEVSTQQAAELLKVSRPHLIKLLEKGEIAHRKVGTHRRIKVKDLLDYEESQKTLRRTALDYLSSEAQELNLGYE